LNVLTFITVWLHWKIETSFATFRFMLIVEFCQPPVENDCWWAANVARKHAICNAEEATGMFVQPRLTCDLEFWCPFFTLLLIQTHFCKSCESCRFFFVTDQSHVSWQCSVSKIT
jgi:hypothetical protein